MNKTWLIAGLVIFVGVGLLYSVKQARAFGLWGSNSPVGQEFIERFNLNEDEVGTFFAEKRQEREEEMKQLREERLSQAVEDSVLTEEQKQTLLANWEEHRQEMEQHREEMQTWFEEQGIDQTKLMQYGGLGHHGFGMRHIGSQ